MFWNLFWFALLVAFIWMEASTTTLVCLWFALGSLGALIASLCGLQPWVSWVAFLLIACLTLAFLRPVVRKYLTPRLTRTNTEALIGTTGVVTEPIDNALAQGQVKLGGMYWTARSTDASSIPAGALIRVDRIEGVKVYVTPVSQTAALS